MSKVAVDDKRSTERETAFLSRGLKNKKVNKKNNPIRMSSKSGRVSLTKKGK